LFNYLRAWSLWISARSAKSPVNSNHRDV
jgi:hypothetical protein